ncbi:MAG: M14 family metallocarboxypeptidase [Clostridiales bacterium]|nr:M14 family metallocarboxypeptidase [Clostridiales bacterium]
MQTQGFGIDGLLARYPFLRKEIIGLSVMGREIPVLILGEGAAPCTAQGAEVFFSASHHANESITTPLVLLFLENYCRAIAENENIGGQPARELFQRTRLHIAPLVNPDGVALVNGRIPQNDSYFMQARALAAQYPTIPFPEGWKANIRGVDLNLQYSARWEEARSIKYAQGFTRPGPRDFVGPAPLSEPESRALADYTLAHNFRLILALHTQGEVIYWRYQDCETPRAACIAAAMQNASGYLAEETPISSGNAGYKDWFIQDFRRPGFTVEAGIGENPLPLCDLAAIYAHCEPIFVLALAKA